MTALLDVSEATEVEASTLAEDDVVFYRGKVRLVTFVYPNGRVRTWHHGRDLDIQADELVGLVRRA